MDYLYLPFPLGMSKNSAACDMVSTDEAKVGDPVSVLCYFNSYAATPSDHLTDTPANAIKIDLLKKSL
jgi:hypothetical protein